MIIFHFHTSCVRFCDINCGHLKIVEVCLLLQFNERTIFSSFLLLLLRRFSIGLFFFGNTILFFIVPTDIVVTLSMLLSEDGGKIEQDNLGDANPLPSQELGKLVNGTKKV